MIPWRAVRRSLEQSLHIGDLHCTSKWLTTLPPHNFFNDVCIDDAVHYGCHSGRQCADLVLELSFDFVCVVDATVTCHWGLEDGLGRICRQAPTTPPLRYRCTNQHLPMRYRVLMITRAMSWLHGLELHTTCCHLILLSFKEAELMVKT